MTTKYLTASDMAAACGVDLKTIHNWVDKNNGPPFFRTPGRHLRFKPVDAAAWLRKGGWDVPSGWATAGTAEGAGQ